MVIKEHMVNKSDKSVNTVEDASQQADTEKQLP
jgi:hypothetical protein